MTPVIYLDPSGDEVYRWLRQGLCAWCGHDCRGDQCRVRFCESCTAYWLADAPRDLDDGRPPKEDCPDCVVWWDTRHLHSDAPIFAPGDWMSLHDSGLRFT